jgi:hypothetical protein
MGLGVNSINVCNTWIAESLAVRDIGREPRLD